MRLRWYILLFLIEIALLGGLSRIQRAPGYMDAEYYFTAGTQLAEGNGFSEPFLWNYFDQPTGVPHPSHTYWMPLASIVASLGGWVCSQGTFTCARIPFILLSGLIPPVTASLAYRMTGKTSSAVLAGLFAICSGLYLPYQTTTDTFPLYMLLGSAFFLLMAYGAKGGLRRRILGFGLAGAAAGLLHLTRNDGLVWLAAGLVWILATERHGMGNSAPAASKKFTFGSVIPGWLALCVLFAAGYLLVMGPWMARNQSLFGTLLAPGGSTALWLTDYDEMYSLTSQDINFSHWIVSGLGPILFTRWNALLWNLQTVWVVQGGIILAPLMVWGAFQLRKLRVIWLPLAVLIVLVVVMTVLFPFAGSRGGLLHAGAAVQPFLWALVPSGLEGLAGWGAQRRGWRKEQAFVVFAAGLVVLMIAVTTTLYIRRVVGDNPAQPAWNQGWVKYSALEKILTEEEVSPRDLILVNNPPGFFAVTGRPAIAIPYGGQDQTLAAADQYGARYLLLDENNQRWLSDLYTHPQDQDRFHLITSTGGIHLFEIYP